MKPCLRATSRSTFIIAAMLAVPGTASAQAAPVAQRIMVRNAADLPAHRYKPATPTVSELLEGGPALDTLAEQVRRDTETTLRDYDIHDTATLRELQAPLIDLALLQRDAAALTQACTRYKALTDKPADKLLTCSKYLSLAQAWTPADTPADADARVTESLRAFLNPLPWSIVGDAVVAARAELAMPGQRAGTLGFLHEVIDPAFGKSGEIDAATIAGLIERRTYLTQVLPHRDALLAGYDAYIAAHRSERVDIWPARAVTLDTADIRAPVVIAVWDEGADLSLFPGLLWTNPREEANGHDDDGNGFIDDIHGIGFDEGGQRTPALLADFSKRSAGPESDIRTLVVGRIDTVSGRVTDASRAFAKRMDTARPEELQALAEAANGYMAYVHGTAVSSVAVAGNPGARLLTIRNSGDTWRIPPPPFTEEGLQRNARNTRSAVDYMKAHGARVINMSWGANPRNFEDTLAANGAGGTPEQRRALANRQFAIGADAVRAAITGAPELLFVAAAGNSDDDSEFTAGIPNSIEAPNLLVVGAVDRSGQLSGFSTQGKQVRIYANGERVPARLPGGEWLPVDGTSIAAPAVTALAGQLFALDPTLTPADVIRLILDGASKSEDGKRLLLDPKQSVELLRNRMRGAAP